MMNLPPLRNFTTDGILWLQYFHQNEIAKYKKTAEKLKFEKPLKRVFFEVKEKVTNVFNINGGVASEWRLKKDLVTPIAIRACVN